jgi:2-dehydropantoate 2-reductase
MRLLVIGAGSTGGYFGGRLAQAGRDVTFLVRPGRYAQLKEKGLAIVSPHGNVTLTPRLITAGEVTAAFDAVLLAVKAFALEAAIADFAPAVGPDTMILPMLNGLKHMDRLAARFGRHAVLGGVCKVMGELDADGQIIQLTRLQELSYGEMEGPASERLARVDSVMRGAGFDAKLSTTIEREMWEKWILLASIGALTCLLRGDLREIAAAAEGRELARQLFQEVISVASALGHPPSPEAVRFAQAIVGGLTPMRTSSLYRDLQAGKPIEGEQIVGDLVERARRAGVPAPLLAAAHASLSIYEGRLATSAGS